MCQHIYNPETQYPEGTPFTYLISWSHLDIHYYGVRYKKTCHPDDLWKNYFTSSKYVKEFIKENGEPDIVKVDFVYDTKEEAKEYEYYYIKNNKLVQDPKWLNKGNGGKDYFRKNSYVHSNKTKQKISIANKKRIRINNGLKEKKIKPEKLQEYLDLGWFIGPLPVSEKTCQIISEFMTGRIRINNGIKEKLIKPEFLKDYLDDEWFLGPLTRTKEHNKKISNAHLGKTHSDEHKRNNGLSKKGTIRINNGIKEKLIKPELLQDFLDLNWNLGPLPRTEEHCKKISDTKKSMTWVNNNIEQKYIKKIELLDFLNNGWSSGMLPITEEFRIKLSNSKKGKIWINNGSIQKFVEPEDAKNIYYPKGFVNGMIKRRK